MATQSLEFGYTTGQTLTAKLFAIGSDTLVATAGSVTEATNRKGRYVAAYTDVAAGDYLQVVYIGSDGVSSECYTLTLTTATFQPWSEYEPIAGGSGGDATAANQTLILDQLDVIQAKTDLLNAQNSSLANPAAEYIYLVRGDSYDGTANALKSFTVTKNYTGWTGTLTVRHRNTDASLCSVSVTVASSTTLTASFSASDTAFSDLLSDDEFGPHPFDIQMVSGSSKQQAKSGVAVISKDQTRT